MVFQDARICLKCSGQCERTEVGHYRLPSLYTRLHRSSDLREYLEVLWKSLDEPVQRLRRVSWHSHAGFFSMGSFRRWNDRPVAEADPPVPCVPKTAEKATLITEDKPEDADGAGERAR